MSRFQVRCTNEAGNVAWLYAIHEQQYRNDRLRNRYHDDRTTDGRLLWFWGESPTWFHTEREAKTRLKTKHVRRALTAGSRVDIVQVVETYHVVHSSVEDAVSKLGLIVPQEVA